MNTLDFYQAHAKEFFAQTIHVAMQNVYQPFLENLPTGKQIILEIGCGSGRDSVFFVKQGFEVTAIDGSQNLIALAKQQHSQVDWQCLTFDKLPNQAWQNRFTGIWACASLLHVPFNKLPSILNDLLAMLQVNGIVYASFKYGDSERIKDGRFFCDINEPRWQMIEKNLNFAQTSQSWQTIDNRADRQEIWWNVLLVKV